MWGWRGWVDDGLIKGYLWDEGLDGGMGFRDDGLMMEQAEQKRPPR